MKKKLFAFLALDVLLVAALTLHASKKSMHVKHFIKHTIEEKDSFYSLLLSYNPSLVAGSKLVDSLVNDVSLLNPHIKTIALSDSLGAQVSIPVFKVKGDPESWLLVACGEEREFFDATLLDRAIDILAQRDHKEPISVINLDANKNLMDQFVGEAGHW